MEVKDIIKQLPKGEKIAVRFENSKGDIKYIISRSGTQGAYKTIIQYKLYSLENENLVYTKQKSEDPLELEEFIDLN